MSPELQREAPPPPGYFFWGTPLSSALSTQRPPDLEGPPKPPSQGVPNCVRTNSTGAISPTLSQRRTRGQGVGAVPSPSSLLSHLAAPWGPRVWVSSNPWCSRTADPLLWPIGGRLGAEQRRGVYGTYTHAPIAGFRLVPPSPAAPTPDPQGTPRAGPSAAAVACCLVPSLSLYSSTYSGPLSWTQGTEPFTPPRPGVFSTNIPRRVAGDQEPQVTGCDPGNRTEKGRGCGCPKNSGQQAASCCVCLWLSALNNWVASLSAVFLFPLLG